MITKHIIIFLLIASIPFSTLLSSTNISLAQNNVGQSFFRNNGTEMILNNTTDNLTLSNDNSQNFSSDFTSIPDTKQWTRVSGIWNYTLDGFHGGIKENVSTPINIAISPATSNESVHISTTFQIHDIVNERPSYVSIIYAFKDPLNYKQAGINVQNGSIDVFANDIGNGIISNAILDPSLDSGFEWDPDTSFNMSLLIDDGKQTLSLNGIEYSISMNDTNMDGRVGLGYGGVGSITFYDFKT